MQRRPWLAEALTLLALAALITAVFAATPLDGQVEVRASPPPATLSR
jgi:hypothetical protein